MKKLLHMSGGGFRGIGFAGYLSECVDRFEVVSGVSIGAVLAVPYMLGKIHQISDVFLNISPKDVFSVQPVSKNNQLTVHSTARLVIGKSAGKQDRLRDLIKEFVSKDEFDNLCTTGKKCYVGYTNVTTGRIIIRNVLTMEYPEYLDAVCASAAIPVYTENVWMNGDRFYDGGILSHIIAHFVNVLEANPGDESTCLFSRPETRNLKLFKPRKYIQANVDLIMRLFDMMLYEISLRDQQQNDEYCKDHKIINKNIFMDDILLHVYDTDNKRLLKLFEHGQELALGYRFDRFKERLWEQRDKIDHTKVDEDELLNEN